MTQSEISKVEELIRNGPDLRGLPPVELRKVYENSVRDITPVPANISASRGEIAGVNVVFFDLAEAPNTTIVYFHGGGYVVGSPTSHQGLIGTLANLSEARAIGVDYSKAPEHVFPAAVNDAYELYTAVREECGADHNIVVAGDSAGGGLGLALCLRLRDNEQVLPSALVLLSPFADLTATNASYDSKKETDLLVSREIAAGMGAIYLGDADATETYASPGLAMLHDLPPVLIHVSNVETLIDDSFCVARGIAEHKGTVELKIWDAVPHVWQLYAGILTEGQQSLYEVGAFIQKHTT